MTKNQPPFFLSKLMNVDSLKNSTTLIKQFMIELHFSFQDKNILMGHRSKCENVNKSKLPNLKTNLYITKTLCYLDSQFQNDKTL